MHYVYILRGKANKVLPIIASFRLRAWDPRTEAARCDICVDRWVPQIHCSPNSWRNSLIQQDANRYYRRKGFLDEYLENAGIHLYL